MQVLWATWQWGPRGPSGLGTHLASGLLRCSKQSSCQNEEDTLHAVTLPRPVRASASSRYKTARRHCLCGLCDSYQGFPCQGRVRVMKKIAIKLPVSAFFKIVVIPWTCSSILPGCTLKIPMELFQRLLAGVVFVRNSAWLNCLPSIFLFSKYVSYKLNVYWGFF